MLVENKKERHSEIPSASLADIAFLLLTFFLLSTTIDMDKGIPMVLPERGGEAKINPKNIAKILVNDAGMILFEEEPVDENTLEERLRTKLQERGLDSDEKPKLIVSIKTDRQTDYNDYITVLDIVKESGATKISIAEPER